MTQLVLDIPDHSLLAFGNSAEQTGKALRLAAAMKLYEIRKLSSGAAAELAGMTRTCFLERLQEFSLPCFDYDVADFARETRIA